MQRGLTIRLVTLLVVGLFFLSLSFSTPAAAAPWVPFQFGTWVPYPNIPPTLTADLGGVAMTSSTNGWISGDAGVILRFDGTNWVQEDTPTMAVLDAVTTVPGSDVEAWAVGENATVIHRTAAGWSLVSIAPVTSQMHSVDMVSATEGWMVGDGVILHTANGADWTAITPSPTASSMFSIAMVDATEGWAVGEAGLIMHYSSGTWAPFASPTSNDLFHVYARTANDVWAVGAGATIVHWTGGPDWVVVPSNATGTLYAVAMPAANDGWASGTGGNLLHWNGMEWSLEQSTGDVLYFVGMVSTTDGWAVGRHLAAETRSQILRLNPAPLPVRAHLPFVAR